jgi:hypothetical protein
MGDLVMFRPPSSATPRMEAPRPSEGAKILFFTGVRYERAEPASTGHANQTPPEGGLNGAAGRGKRKRRA